MPPYSTARVLHSVPTRRYENEFRRLAGDGLMTIQIVTASAEQKVEHPWMEVLLTPYIIIFSLATVVSVSTIVLKVKTFVEYFKEQNTHPEVLARRVGPIRFDAIEFPAEFAQLEAVQELKKSFRANHRDRLKLYCALILGLLEGAPHLRSSLQACKSPLWCAPRSHGWCAPALTCRLPNGDAVVVFSH
jgi:hypothetical protein